MQLMSGIPRQQMLAMMPSPLQTKRGKKRNVKAQAKAELLLILVFYLNFKTRLFSLAFFIRDVIAFVISLRSDFAFDYMDDLILKLFFIISMPSKAHINPQDLISQPFLMRLIQIFKKFQLQFKSNMGGSSNKIKLAIIDENERQEDFQPMKNESTLNIAYYKSLQQFLENQSLKKLSYIVIREKQKSQSELDKEGNSIMAKKLDNLQELTSQFHHQRRQKSITVREKLIAYIKKFSLQKLVIYLYIKNVHNYKVPDYEAPYLTLISDSLQAIIDHVKAQPKREEPAIFKFKRLVKDLYRRSTVRIFVPDPKQQKQPDGSEAEWKQLMSKNKITVEFSYDTTSFEQSLISNYSDYIIVNTPQLLTYILDAKKQFQFESKIIYFGDEEEVQHKKNHIWMVSKGRTLAYKTIVADTIKRCSDLITDKSSARPKLTIIFTTNHYTREQKQLVKIKAVQCLKKATKQQDKRWIDEMQIIVTSNYDRLKSQIKNFVYTYLVTFDCTVPQSQDLKAWLKKNNLGNRIYLYNLELKADKKSKSSQNKQSRLQKISKDVETMVTKAGFKIKFEIGPLESIALFQMGDKQYRYFSSKLGLITTKIDQQLWRAEYCKKNRVKIIDNYYIVCNVNGYLRKLKGLIAEEAQQPNSYFKDLKVIVYDKKQALQQNWDELKNAQNIAFVHYNLSKIEDFLDIVFVPSLKLTIFVKKSLPLYMEAVRSVEETKSRHIKLFGVTVQKSNLLKEVFSQEVITTSKFGLHFRHFSITNRNLQESIDTLYNFVAKFANLWRVGYEIIKAKQDKGQVIDTLKADIKASLYKCKSYSLLEVSDDDFDYFYIKRLDICQTFLDLQIAVIYMTTLPHGFNKILEQIFCRPKQNCMIPKVFSAFMLVFLTAFCCVEDEVMSNTKLVVYFDDNDLAAKMGSLNIGDTLFNTSFIPTGKNESEEDNVSNHCLFIQFQTIPMLSESFIRNYLYIERFSFYKEAAEYLIAPFTRFVLKNKILTSNGKYHLYLQAVNDQTKGFIQKVFSANSIDYKELFNTIKEEIYSIYNDDANLSKMTHDVKSLYKKSEIISLYEQKKEMVKSINDSLQYKNFLNAMSKDRYLSALNHLNIKQKQQKMTTQLQAHYFKAMLGVERSLIYFKINQFDQGIKVLQKVQKFLENQSQNWVKRNIRTFKESMMDLSTKRHKLFNRAPKTKKWKIYTDREANNPQKTSFSPVVVMKQEEFSWTVDYLPKKQQFYIANSKDSQTAILPYKVKQNYGEPVASFTNDMVYEKEKLVQLVESQKQIKDYFKYKIDKRLTKLGYQVTQEIFVKNYSTSPAKLRNNRDQSELNKSKDKLSSQQVRKVAQNEQEKKTKKEPTFIELQAPKNIFEEFQKEEQQKAYQPIKSMSKLTPIKNLNNFEKLLGVTQAVGWQSFYIGDKFVLTKKGKHMKGKMLNKIQ